MSSIQVFYNKNVELMSKLMKGQTVNIGDGLTMTMKHQLLPNELDMLEFSFFLESRPIGHLYDDFGGYIAYDYNPIGAAGDWQPINDELQDKVTTKLMELFPTT